MIELKLVEVIYQNNYICFRSNISKDNNTFVFHITRYYPYSLNEIKKKIGNFNFYRILFHIYAYESIKYFTAGPIDLVDFNVLNDYIDYPSYEFFKECYKKILISQWSYENNLDYVGPEWKYIPSTDVVFGPFNTNMNDKNIMMLCGGGKDTLLCAKLLELVKKEKNTNISMYHESINVYGVHCIQQQISQDFHTNCKLDSKYLTHYVMEDFFESPIFELLNSQYKHMGAVRAGAENYGSPGCGGPFSTFFAMINQDSNYLLVAEEKSADIPSVEKNEEINHQLGKSTKFNLFQKNYIRDNLWKQFEHHSVLKSLYDTNIFRFLNILGKDCLKYTSSCNIAKPWCKKCAKCAYVWLGFKTYCWENADLDDVFNENLFDKPELLEYWNEMLGLRNHNALECVGSIQEIQLMFYILYSRGEKGVAMNIYKNNIHNKMNKEYVKELWDKKTKIYQEGMNKFINNKNLDILKIQENICLQCENNIEKLLGSN